MPIIYIAGLARSGTTFLQSQLLRHNNVVALGEVSQTIKAIKNFDENVAAWKVKAGIKSENYWNKETYPELIGRINNDTFWGSIQNEIKLTADIRSAIELVYNKAIQIYPNHIIIDSSKHVGHLNNVLKISSYKREVKALLCIRDYRGWFFSIKKHQARARLHSRNSLIEKYKWMYSNKKILNLLKKDLEGGYKVISYESLVFCFKETMEMIALFCGLSGITTDLNINKFHEILGSQSLKKNLYNNEISYDIQWFPYIPNILEQPILLFNKKIYEEYSCLKLNKKDL